VKCSSPAFDRREPNEPVSLQQLKELGVVYWKVQGEDDPKLQAIRVARGYTYKVA
jgi:1,2-dihydroxy-3-keto-5-methylthiopentene dioxygenase